MTNKDGVGDTSDEENKRRQRDKVAEAGHWRHHWARWPGEASVRNDESESERIQEYKENCFRPREQQVQRSGGRNKLGVSEEPQEASEGGGARPCRVLEATLKRSNRKHDRDT